MPAYNIGDKTNLDGGNLFLELKAKGEKITFKLAQGNYTYTGKHFSKGEEGKWLVQDCPRIMQEEHCETCEQFFALNKEVKELKEKKAKESEIDKVKKEADKFKPRVKFNYAILNRDSKIAQILKVSLSVRLKIDEYYNKGFSVVGADFICERTEKPGSEYYSLLRLDSADVKPLDDKETKEFAKAEAFDLSELTLAKEGSNNLEEPPVPEEE